MRVPRIYPAFGAGLVALVCAFVLAACGGGGGGGTDSGGSGGGGAEGGPEGP
jgi:hypothetical protein